MGTYVHVHPCHQIPHKTIKLKGTTDESFLNIKLRKKEN